MAGLNSVITFPGSLTEFPFLISLLLFLNFLEISFGGCIKSIYLSSRP